MIGLSRDEAQNVLRDNLADDFDCLACAAIENDRIVLFAKGPKSRRKIAARMSASTHPALRRARIRPVPHEKMLKARSLEAVANLFGRGTPLYDPSGAIGRGRALVALTAALRDRVPESVRLALYDPRAGQIVIVLRQPAGSWSCDVINETLTQAQAAFGELAPACFNELGDDFTPGVRFVFETPAGTLTPIDTRSARRVAFHTGRRRLGKVARTFAALAIGVLHTNQAIARTGGGSNVTGQISGSGGSIDSNGTFTGTGSINATFGNGLGMQGQIAGGEYHDHSFWQAGAHLFYRDPETGLIGLTGTWEELGDQDRWRIGVEGEYYQGSFTVFGEVGYEQRNLDMFGFGNRMKEKDVYALGGFGFYPDPNVGLFVSGGVVGGDEVVEGTIEWQPAFESLSGLAFFASGGVTGGDEGYILGGIRFYFGTPKNLIDRHREDIIRDKVHPAAIVASGESDYGERG